MSAIVKISMAVIFVAAIFVAYSIIIDDFKQEYIDRNLSNAQTEDPTLNFSLEDFQVQDNLTSAISEVRGKIETISNQDDFVLIGFIFAIPSFVFTAVSIPFTLAGMMFNFITTSFTVLGIPGELIFFGTIAVIFSIVFALIKFLSNREI